MQKISENSLADKWHCINHSNIGASNISRATYLCKQYLTEEVVDPTCSFWMLLEK